MQRQIPLFTLAGVPNAQIDVHPFETNDGLGQSVTRFRRGAGTQDAVLILHGLTQSSDMFIMPEHKNLVSYLHDNGFADVWCADSRMSNRLPYNSSGAHYNLDDVALHDHPAAIAEVRKHIGDRPLHVIAHCLGSATFMMSLAAKTVTHIASVICNAVSLTPRVPGWSYAKLSVAPALLEYGCGQPFASPAWDAWPSLSLAKTVARVASLVHRECDVPGCHMLSLMWGSGRPALYEHDNLLPVTHARIGDLHGPTGFEYHRHVRKMARAGAAVKLLPGDARYAALPDDYMAKAADITTPTLFVAGAKNHVFTDSNIVCYQKLEQIVPGRHALQVFPTYGHNDVFMGKSVAEDIFPAFLRFLSAQRAKAKAA